MIGAAFPDMQLTVEDMIAEGEKVVVRSAFSGTHQGELFGIPATGKRVTRTSVIIFRLAKGEIVEGWYGQPWGRPYWRIRDYVQIMRKVLRREAKVMFTPKEGAA